MKDRMVCECYGITVNDIKNELIKGAEGFDELEKTIHLGVMCSACIADAKKVIDELKTELNKG